MMNKIEHPIQSLASLVKALIAALILAAIILITAVLPAEYGVDPTGLGKAMGLTVLAEPAGKTEKPDALIAGSCDESAVLREDSVELVVPAHSGIEFKLHIEKGSDLEYSWKTEGAPMYFDFHGEPQGDTTGYFKSYKETIDNKDNGSKKVPFTGSHGWYWKNESKSAITVYLETKGKYKVIGLR